MDNENIYQNTEEIPDIIEYKKKKTSVKDVLLFILRIGIAAGIISWMIFSEDDTGTKNYVRLSEALKNFDFLWLIPAAILYFLHLLAGAWRWYLLLKVQKIKITFFEALSLSMQGFFFSLVLPGGQSVAML